MPGVALNRRIVEKIKITEPLFTRKESEIGKKWELFLKSGIKELTAIVFPKLLFDNIDSFD